MANQTTVIACPACQKKLKLKQAIQAGTKLRCSGCNQGFRATAEMMRPAAAAPTPNEQPAASQPVASQPANPAPVAQQPVTPPAPAAAPANKSFVTAIYVACGVILLSAIIFAAPSFLNSNTSQAGTSPAAGDPSGSENPAAPDANPDRAPEPDPTRNGGDSADTKPVAKGRQDEPDPDPRLSAPTQPDTKPPITADPPPVEPGKAPEPPAFGTGPGIPANDPNRPGDVADVKNQRNNDDDPNRPGDADPVVNDVNDLKPVGGIAGFKKMVNSPPPRRRFFRPIVIVRQVPLPLPRPLPRPRNPTARPPASGTTTPSQPVVSVQIQPIGTTVSPLVIDNRASPGLTAQLGVNLSGTPTSPVTVNVTPPRGVSSNQTSLTFAANVAPTQQTITLTGDGTGLAVNQSRLDFVRFAANSTGLSAGSPVQVPVNLVRRNRYVIFHPGTGGALTLIRGDVLAPSSRTIWLIFSNGAPGTVLALGQAPPRDYYTEDHVEIVIPPSGSVAGGRIRLTDTQVLEETRAGVFTPLPGVVSSWE